MRFAILTVPALAALASAQDLSSLIAGQSSIISVIQTASDPGAAASSYVSQLTTGLNPSQLSQFNSLSSQIGQNPELSSLATATGAGAMSSASSALASLTSAGSSARSTASSSRSSVTGGASSSAASVTAMGGSSSGNAAPTNFVAGGLMGAAGVVGAAAMLL